MTSTPRAQHPGFRSWHQRQLFEAFAWLTTCLLSGVVIATIFEFIGLHTPGLTPLLTLTALYFLGLMALISFSRFWRQLAFAQQCANEATCNDCGAYGLFEVSMFDDQIPAICRKCGHRWTIG